MNTETGQVYRRPEDIEAALARNEPVVPVSEHVATLMEKATKAARRLSWRERWFGSVKP